MRRSIGMVSLLIILLLLQGGCTQIPKGVEPVQNFELARYLGRWYEIARLDHSFERNMSHVTAQYVMRNDDSVEVINRGFDMNKQTWGYAMGSVKFVGEENTGHLKVSFFGPFYGSYIIFELDEKDYQYAFVSGYNKDYLWLLARTPSVDDALKQHFVKRAQELGFATDQLIFVDQ